MISCPFHFQLSEKGKPYVDIQGLTASTMEILLDFVYTETVHVTVENVQELLPAACLLQLKGTAAEACTHSGPRTRQVVGVRGTMGLRVNVHG